MNFKELHFQESPILICNVWDVVSAKAAQELNFKSIGTSSGAIASMLGYPDGEKMSFTELEYIVERITKSTELPLTVDLEAGYSRNPSEIVENIIKLTNLGVVGVNIEDSIVGEKRELMSSDSFAELLEKINSSLIRQNQKVFINVRTDTFLIGISNPIQETIERAKKYKNAGAGGLFVPCIVKEKDIAAVIENIDLPLNVMCMPNLPDFVTLQKLGVKRISMGGFVQSKLTKVLEKELSSILQNNSFENLFAKSITQ